jgi:RND family efflux transporter MFP subunit
LPASNRGKKAAGLVLLFLLVAGGVVSIALRARSGRALAAETERLAVLTVATVQPSLEKPDDELVLPATLQAYTESPIYARTNGYMLKWFKDIGSRIQKGELLAEIDTPEVDQELLQARATRKQAEARLQLARSSADRWQGLRQSDSVSQQETDERASGYEQAQADLAAADANVKRLEQLESFKHVYAPFSGVLTKRNVDIGALINSGNGGTNRELFDVADISPLRVFVSVPQAYAQSVHAGVGAAVEIAEFARGRVQGRVVRTADAIDPATRTLLTEIDVPNPAGKLLPGAFAQVHFPGNANVSKLTVPVNAILFRAEGPRAAVVGPQGVVELRKLAIGRDYGTSLEILGGLGSQDRVVINPSDSLEDGQSVQLAQGETR